MQSAASWKMIRYSFLGFFFFLSDCFLLPGQRRSWWSHFSRFFAFACWYELQPFCW
jgi:hypothetical protein